MMRVHALDNEYPGKLKAVPPFWHPVYINRRWLSEMGIAFRYYQNIEPGLCDCDALLLSSRFFHLEAKSADEKARALETVSAFSNQGCAAVWLDMRDSTGNTQFEVLPHVAAYWKKQLLKDRSLYQKIHYGNRLFTHYFHLRFGVDDSHQEDCALLPGDQSHKLDVSWNLGMFDNRLGGNAARVANAASDWITSALRGAHRMPVRCYDAPRSTNMLALFGMDYDRATVAFQRNHAHKILSEMQSEGIVFGGKVSRAKYNALLKDSKIVLSLFGWGELCYRDYEAFLSGAALLMPDVEHLETWPNFYEPRATYWPLQWDLSNLKEAYHHLIHDESARLEIARQGQERYRQAWSQEGRKLFCERLAARLRALRI